MKYLPTILIILLFAVLSSCDNSKKTSPAIEKIIDYDSINIAEISSLIKQYNAIHGWQDSNVFSYELQRDLQGEVISLEGRIRDVIKVDQSYVLNIEGSKKITCIAHLIIDSIQLSKIDSYKKKNFKCCFILKVQKVNPILSQSFNADGYFVGDPDDEGTYGEVEVEIDYKWGRVVQIKGILIDFYAYKYDQ